MNCPKCGAKEHEHMMGGTRKWWTCGSYGYEGKMREQSELCCEAEAHAETRAKLDRLKEVVAGFDHLTTSLRNSESQLLASLVKASERMEKMREALQWIASQSTGQEASPTQCSMVVRAMGVLEAL